MRGVIGADAEGVAGDGDRIIEKDGFIKIIAISITYECGEGGDGDGERGMIRIGDI